MPYATREAKNAAARRRYQNDEVARNKHKALASANRKKYRAAAAEWRDLYLTTRACVDCSENDAEVLDFDHVTGEKLANISDLVRSGASIAKLAAEVAKCEIRCANCHRRITRKRERDELREQ